MMSTLNPDLSKPTCRVCLQNNLEEEMSSIFDLDRDLHNLRIYEQIEHCADIKILQHDQMPTLICGDCYGILKVSYKFRTICRNSNEYLNEVLAIGKITPKMEKNPLSVSSINASKQDNKHNKYKPRFKEKSNTPSKIIKNEKSSPTHSELSSEDYIEDNFADKHDDEVWFDVDYSKDEDYLCSSELMNKVSNEKVDANIIKGEIEDSQDSKKSIKQLKKSNAKNKKPNNTLPSKTLEISSDGAAIIRERKTRVKREKKEKQLHICDVCGNKYQRRYGLEIHMRRHRDEKPFECEICAHAFHCNFELIRHMRKHTGSRPYKCSYCPRAFGDQSTLIKHERLHRNERPFKCDTCGKSFTYSNVLKHHILTHTGEKPYTCELCGKCFARPHHLRAHLETLQHLNDPRSKELLQNIRKNNESDSTNVKRIIIKI